MLLVRFNRLGSCINLFAFEKSLKIMIYEVHKFINAVPNKTG